MIKTIVRRLLVPAVAAAAIAGPAHAGKADDTLVFGDGEDITSFDKYYSNDRIGIVISNLIFDTLVYKDPATNKILPMLATAWRMVGDETIEFDLRSGVTFHDGETFEADDVVYTLGRAIDPAVKIPTAQNTNWIRAVEKTGPMQVRIHTKGPFPAALQYLAGPIPIYGKDYYSKVGPEGMNKQPVGSGPYKVVRAVHGQSTQFARNEQYWKGGPRQVPAIGKIVLRTIPDANTQMAELMTGGIDFMWRFTKDQADAMSAMPSVVVARAETMRVAFLSMEVAGRGGPNPFMKKEVRQAVMHAVNRPSIVKQLLGEGAQVLNAICFPAQVGCTQDVKRYDYNPEAARKLLADAGYPEGFSVRLGGYQFRPLAEAIAADLRKVGVRAELAYGQYAPVLAQQRSGKVTFNFMSWGSFSINDASAIVGSFYTFGDDDVVRDPQVRDWVSVAGRTIDEKVRAENYKKALNRIADEAFVMPLWSVPAVYAFNSALNFKPSVDEIPRFELSTWK